MVDSLVEVLDKRSPVGRYRKASEAIRTALAIGGEDRSLRSAWIGAGARVQSSPGRGFGTSWGGRAGFSRGHADSDIQQT